MSFYCGLDPLLEMKTRTLFFSGQMCQVIIMATILQPLHRTTVSEAGSGFVHSSVFLEEFKAPEITNIVVTATNVQSLRTGAHLPVQELNGRKPMLFCLEHRFKY